MDAAETDAELSEARVAQWRALSPATRLQFAGPAPGAVREEGCGSVEMPSQDIPVQEFVLLLLVAMHVDVVDLRRNERCVFIEEDGHWSSAFLNP